MIPLRDDVRARAAPLVNWTLIALCSVGFGVELALASGTGVDRLIEQNGLVPQRFLTLSERFGLLYPPLYAPLVTSIFLHGGYLHYLFNMLFLWIFGRSVEGRLGHLRYASFFLLGGAFAGAAHIAANPSSVVPTIGASGAIAAVMGAYLVLFPRARIESLLLLGFFVRVVSIPAFLYLLAWFGLQLLQGSLALERAEGAGGVAWWAHAGGFLFGASFVSLLGLRPRARRLA